VSLFIVALLLSFIILFVTNVNEIKETYSKFYELTKTKIPKELTNMDELSHTIANAYKYEGLRKEEEERLHKAMVGKYYDYNTKNPKAKIEQILIGYAAQPTDFVALFDNNHIIKKNQTVAYQETRNEETGEKTGNVLVSAPMEEWFKTTLTNYYSTMNNTKIYYTPTIAYDGQRGMWAMEKLTNEQGDYIGFVGIFSLIKTTKLEETLKELAQKETYGKNDIYIYSLASKLMIHTTKTTFEEDKLYIDAYVIPFLTEEKLNNPGSIYHTTAKHQYAGIRVPYKTSGTQEENSDILILLQQDISFGHALETMSWILLVVYGILFFLMCFVAVLLTYSTSFIIDYLGKNLGYISNLEFERMKAMPGYCLFTKPFAEIRQLEDGMSVVKKALVSFRKYVPLSVVRQILVEDNATELGMTPSHMTILFIDIEGFTSLSERGDAKIFVEQLSDYFGAISDLVEDYDGVVDKYIGDAIMAWWNHKYKKVRNHEMRACQAVLQIFSRLATLNKEWTQRGQPELNIRCGLNTGDVRVGNMGSVDRLNYTAIGDAVNIASRLEAVNKYFGTRCLIGPETYRGVQADILCQWVDRVALKGKMNGIDIYTLIDKYTQSKGYQQELARDLLEIRKSMLRRDFAAMTSLVKDACNRPHQVPKHVKLLAERADGLSQIGECKDVDVTFIMNSK